MAGKGINGIGVGLAATGGILIYSGIYNRSVGDILRSVASGKKPTPGPAEQFATSATDTPATSGGSVPAPVASGAGAAANQAIARLLAAPYGWSVGNQWNSLVAVWNRESGWNNLALNPGSGAFGIAQALGHGTSGTAGKYGNQYPSESANNGDASAQISWGLTYIKDTYGDPAAAWAHEESAGWY